MNKRVINLKEKKEGYTGRLEGGKKKGEMMQVYYDLKRKEIILVKKLGTSKAQQPEIKNKTHIMSDGSFS